MVFHWWNWWYFSESDGNMAKLFWPCGHRLLQPGVWAVTARLVWFLCPDACSDALSPASDALIGQVTLPWVEGPKGWWSEAIKPPKLVQTGNCLVLSVHLRWGSGQSTPSRTSLGSGRKAPVCVHLLQSVQSQQHLLQRNGIY